MPISSKVSSFGLKVMTKMRDGKQIKILPDGRAKAGRMIIPRSLTNELLRMDLAKKIGAEITLTSVGEAYLRRTNQLQRNCAGRLTDVKHDPFAAQHSRFRVEVRKNGRKVEKTVRNIGESPLAWLLKRKGRDGRSFLSEDQFEAGETLSRDFEYSGLIPRTTSFYDGIPITGKMFGPRSGDTRTVTQIAAKRRVQRALEFVGPGLSAILIRICCFHEGLEQAERNLLWPTRSGKLVLGLALDRLVEFYNPKNNQNG